MECVMWSQCFAAYQCFYLVFSPYVLSFLYPPSSLVNSLYWLPMHLMPKGNYAAGTATAASYLILPKRSTGAGNKHCRQKSFPDPLFEMVQSITQFSIPHSQEESENACLSFTAFFFPSPRMPLEMRCLIAVAVAAAAIEISAKSKYSLHCNRMKKCLLSRHMGAVLLAGA